MAHYNLFDDERCFVFSVDPKCGCTTIKDWFGRIVGLSNDEDPQILTPRMRPTAEVWASPDHTRIWFIRDPLRRLVSFYLQFVVSDSPHWCFADDDGDVRLEDASFEDFIRTLGVLEENGRRPQHHLEPQTRALLGVPFDRIIKIEDLARRTDDLLQLLDIEERPGHENRQAPGEHTAHEAWKLRPDEIRELPPITHESFWSDELRGIARRVYTVDCSFHDGL